MNTLLQTALFFLCCSGVFAQYGSYDCNNWCNVGGLYTSCCDLQVETIQPITPDNAKPSPCIYRPCPDKKYHAGNPSDECNNLDEDKKCPDSENCCPDDCTQKYVCQPANGTVKECPPRHCEKRDRGRDTICTSGDCPRGDLCCPDDCTSTYICKKPVYKKAD